jgi:hypothetical protein
MIKMIEIIDKITQCFTYLIFFVVLILVVFFDFRGFNNGYKKNTKNLTKNKDVAGFIACQTTYSFLKNNALKNTCFNKLKGK